jgi:outer membrane receptor protein involved in Fe transport
MEAIVYVVGKKLQTTTDEEGRFKLALPPGTYQLRIVAELHKAQRIRNVEVVSGQSAKLIVALEPDRAAVETEATVEAEPVRATAATQLLLRRNAATATDSVGAQEVSRTPDRNAADATRRVVGASVVDGRYIYVRGLGERYTNALLNGVPLPSPEPDRQAVPLDMFPTMVLSDVTIHKTFSPDMPGDFAGGSVHVHTRDMPTKFSLQIMATGGFNTAATFRSRMSYEGGGLDWLGIDSGGRAFPSDLPKSRIERVMPDGSLNKNLDAYGRSMMRPMTTARSFTPANHSFSVVVGDSFNLGKERKLGYQVAASYNRKYLLKTGEIARTYTVDLEKPGALRLLNDYAIETGTDLVNWSGFGSLTWTMPNHTVSAMGLYTRSSENEAREILGFNEERRADISDTRLRFTSRAMTMASLRGEHIVKKADDAKVSWHFALANANMVEPDTREMIYTRDARLGYDFTEATLSGSHFFADQSERTTNLAVNWQQPLSHSKTVPKFIKFGTMLAFRSRQFDARRFRYLRVPGADPSAYLQPAGTLFRPENVGTLLELSEYTRPNDAYDATSQVLAGYIMSDVWLHPRWRLVVGERIERGVQTMDSFDPFAPVASRTSTELARTDLLPSASLLFKATDTANLRVSVTRTVARPQLRELAPFAFTDYFGAREILGNPKLDRTNIVNGDLRFEWFPGGSDVIAVSTFVKQFTNPIEPVIIPTSRGVISFANADGATNLGIELEGRKSLAFVHPALKGLSALANLTLVRSRVSVDPRGGVQTSTERPMAGQSPYIINAAVDYEHDKLGFRVRVLYNMFGKRIAQVGSERLPDTYEAPRHQLDATVMKDIGRGFELRLLGENLLNAPVRLTQGVDRNGDANEVSSFRLGATVSLNVAYTR